MSKFTRQFKAKYQAKILLPSTRPVLGLPVRGDAEIAVADTAEYLVLADVDTGQEWALAKASLSDIGIINISKLKQMLNSPGRTLETLSELGDLVSDLISLDLTNILGSMSRAANDYCLVAAYVQGGANQVVVLHVGPEKADRCRKIVDGIVREYGSRFLEHVPVSRAVAGRAQAFGDVVRDHDVASLVLCEAIFGGDQTDKSEPEPHSDEAVCCASCGQELRPGARFCPHCGERQQS